MKTDDKVLYFLRKYKLDNRCVCKECGNFVFKSSTKGYDYRCLKCDKSLFASQVIATNTKPITEDIKLMKETVIKYL